jgi:hypothetical protein
MGSLALGYWKCLPSWCVGWGGLYVSVIACR